MATYDLDEQEQLDSLKTWWKRWGSVAMLTLAIVVAAGAGWRYWQNRTMTQSLEAASVYQNLTQSLAANDTKGARAAGAMLIEKYQDTAFAPRAALLLAKLNVVSKDHSDAFAFRFLDLKGDVLLAQGKPADARAAYQSAFSKMADDNPYRSIVELKLDAMGGAAK
ncbi:MAG: hypothetical protein B7Z35_14160 [Hydrogenophilales bacterium 12-61-10]|nr:MAG: hypothetical protein B7Z35_14160 [Hydrogenophilales bacterium 12-61-10]